MFHIEGCVLVENIRCGAPRANGAQRRNGLRSAVTIGVFASPRGLRA